MGQAITVTVRTESPEQTEALGSRLGSLLTAGDIVTLSGELGGGKTCFVRGIVATAAPESADMVSSPTFAILNEYPGKQRILHYDCYRLRGADDAVEMGLEDHLNGSGICLIEWPERIRTILPADRLDVSFAYTDDNTRQIGFISQGHRASMLLEQFAAYSKDV